MKSVPDSCLTITVHRIPVIQEWENTKEGQKKPADAGFFKLDKIKPFDDDGQRPGPLNRGLARPGPGIFIKKRQLKLTFFKRSVAITLSEHVNRSTVSGRFATACSAEAGKAKTQ